MAATDAKHHHDYHLVNPSPWPVIASIFALVMMIGAVIWMRSMSEGPGLFGVTGFVFLLRPTWVAGPDCSRAT